MANYTILLVDYEPRSIERTRAPLVRAGYVVQLASDGLAAIRAFQDIRPNLVLIEAMIPKKHGFEVCQELKRTPEGKRTPIVITTGVYKGRKYRSQALHIYQCDEYVEKPVTDEQLLGVVRRFLGEPPPSVIEVEPIGDEAVIEVLDDETDSPPRLDESRNPEPRVSDPAEREILDRIDAILPGGGSTSGRAAFATVAEPWAALSGLESSSPHQAPEIEAIEAIEVIEVETSEPEPAPAAEPQVVSIDEARRARKARRDGKARDRVSRESIAPAPQPVTPSEAIPRRPAPPDRSAAPAANALPISVASARSRGSVPGWVWGIGLIGTVIAVYFLFFAG